MGEPREIVMFTVPYDVDSWKIDSGCNGTDMGFKLTHDHKGSGDLVEGDKVDLVFAQDNEYIYVDTDMKRLPCFLIC